MDAASKNMYNKWKNIDHSIVQLYSIIEKTKWHATSLRLLIRNIG